MNGRFWERPTAADTAGLGGFLPVRFQTMFTVKRTRQRDHFLNCKTGSTYDYALRTRGP